MEESELRARLAVLEEAVAWIGAHLPTLEATLDLRRHLDDRPDGRPDVQKAADALLRRIEALKQIES